MTSACTEGLITHCEAGSQSLHWASNIHWADRSGFKRVSIFCSSERPEESHVYQLRCPAWTGTSSSEPQSPAPLWPRDCTPLLLLLQISSIHTEQALSLWECGAAARSDTDAEVIRVSRCKRDPGLMRSFLQDLVETWVYREYSMNWSSTLIRYIFTSRPIHPLSLALFESDLSRDIQTCLSKNSYSKPSGGGALLK